MEPRVEINFIIAKEDASFSPGKKWGVFFFLTFFFFYCSTTGLIPTGTTCPEIVLGLLAVVMS